MVVVWGKEGRDEGKCLNRVGKYAGVCLRLTVSPDLEMIDALTLVMTSYAVKTIHLDAPGHQRNRADI